MIMTFEYRAALDGKSAADATQAILDHGAGLKRIRPFLLDVDVEHKDAWLHVTLRLTDIERSRISVNARKTILAMSGKAKLDPRRIVLWQALEEPNARSFITGQGRTPRPRRPRSLEARSQAS